MKKIIDLLLNLLLNLFKRSWWVEIATASPRCAYYFGPFSSEDEARQNQPGYVDDLQQEGSEVLRISVARRRTPTQLTVDSPTAA